MKTDNKITRKDRQAIVVLAGMILFTIVADRLLSDPGRIPERMTAGEVQAAFMMSDNGGSASDYIAPGLYMYMDGDYPEDCIPVWSEKELRRVGYFCPEADPSGMIEYYDFEPLN